MSMTPSFKDKCNSTSPCKYNSSLNVKLCSTVFIVFRFTADCVLLSTFKLHFRLISKRSSRITTRSSFEVRLTFYLVSDKSENSTKKKKCYYKFGLDFETRVLQEKKTIKYDTKLIFEYVYKNID